LEAGVMDRRAIIGGAFCVGGALLARQLKPHRTVSLLNGAKLDDLVPRSFGRWTSDDVGDPLALNGPGTLSSKLYNQLVTRAYIDDRGNAVMMLLAHGEQQSEELQLHRPEVCFPAFGYGLVRNERTSLRLGEAVSLPARRLLAISPKDEESVIYWTRLGEYFPTSRSEQRSARFDNTIGGVLPDGILCRFSVPGATVQGWAFIEQFVNELIVATGAPGRRVLIGTERSQHVGRVA
jgi:EpsI family protein